MRRNILSNIAEILERHKAFWNMEDVEKPLLRVSRYSSHYGQQPPPMKMPLADGTMASGDLFYLEPEMLSPERFSPKDERPSAVPATDGDLLPIRAPFTKVPWMEAIVGCPIRVSLQSSSMWSEPVLGEDWYRDVRSLKPMDRWRSKLLEFTDFLSANSGSYLVANTLMRGPSDMVDAFIGEEELCVGIYEHPDEIHELMAICAEIFIDTAKAQLDRIQPFQDGYCNLFGIWSPGLSIRTQDDASALVSPADYAEFMLPPQERIASEFDYSTIHLHSNSLHVVDAVLDSTINAVQVSMDPQPFGPTVMELLPTFVKMQEKKPILIEGPMMQSELDELLKVLSPRGLYVWAMIESEHDRAQRVRT
jgi:hypothetical protein